MLDYFLVARNVKTNEVNVVSLRENWSKRDGSDDYIRAHSLEALDSITMRFDSKKSFIEEIYSEGCLREPNVDLFIASKHKYKGRDYIRMYELLYKSERTEDLEAITQDKLNGRSLGITNDNVKTFYNKFINKLYSKKDFYTYIMMPYLNLPKSLLESIKDVPAKEKVPNDLKYKFKFEAKDYTTIRNITSAWNEYDSYEKVIKTDDVGKKSKALIDKKLDAINENKNRRLTIPKLLEILDKNFVDGQLSLDSFIK